MRIAALLLLLLRTPDDTAEQFYKFPKDTTWIYAVSNPGDKDKKDRMTMKVTGEADGKVTADMTADGELAKTAKMVWYVADGLFYWAEQKGDSSADAISFYKPGSKKGDTWTVPAKKGSPPQTATHLGTEDVKVAAGEYKNAVHTRVELDENNAKIRLDVFLVEKVGVVKMAYTFGGQEMSFELKEFKPAK